MKNTTIGHIELLPHMSMMYHAESTPPKKWRTEWETERKSTKAVPPEKRP